MRGQKTLILAALAMVLAAAFYGCSKKSSPTALSQDAAQENGRSQLHAVQLKDAKFKETLRLIERDEQTGLNRHIRIEWQSGLTCLVDCDDQGRPRQATIYYPRQTNAGDVTNKNETAPGSDPTSVTDRPVLRKLLFLADGSTVSEETVYDRDRTIRETMVRSGADMVVTCYARESRVEAVRTYDGKTGLLTGEMVFTRANRLASLLIKESGRRARRDMFSEEGPRKLSFVYDEDKVVEVLIWQKDGATLLEKLTRDYSSTTSTAYETAKPSINAPGSRTAPCK